MATIPQALAIAIQSHQAGNVQEAEQIYRQILDVDPQNADALHLLGVLAHQTGEHDIAIDYICQAIAVNGSNAAFYSNLGEAYRASGKFDEAVSNYRQALDIKPDAAEVHNNLGNALQQQGNTDEAVECFQRAVGFKPDYLEVHYNLGNALRTQGRLDEAVECYREAVRIKPDFADAYNSLGFVLHLQGKFDEAAECFQQVVQMRPNSAWGHNNLGSAFLSQGNLDKAVEHFREAIRIKSDFAEAHNNLGNALNEQGKFNEAVKYFHQALSINPDFAEAYNNLGNVFSDLRKFDEAATYYQQALRIKPNEPEVYYNLGVTLTGQGKLDEAVECYQQALRIQPDYAEAHHNLGIALQKQNRLTEAVASLQQALQIEPDFAEAYSNLGNILHAQGKIDEALAHFRRAVAIKPDFAEAYNNLGDVLNLQGKLDEAVANFQQALRIKPDYATAHGNLAFSLNYHSNIEPAAIFAEHRRWGEVHGRFSETPLTYRNLPDPNRRLRIGYVSPDFRRHSAAFFSEHLLTHHDRDHFEIMCYAEVAIPDATTERLHALSDGWWSTCGMTDAQVADLVHTDEIDILVDLAGHTANNRLLVFARKPAPVQVAHAYATTTGITAIDYRLTDRWAEPPEHTDLYTEELVHLPDGFLCYAPPQEAPPVGPLPARETDYITFGSFNNLPKINPQVVALWAKILLATPKARLILKSKPLSDPGTRERYFSLFDANGISRERVSLISYAPSLKEHLGLYNQVDIGLDPFPYNGQVTTFEALWMGVPVVTLAGRVYVGRTGISFLSRLGLTELIADTPQRYVEIAVQLADNLERLSSLRASLRGQMAGSPLCDGQTFTRGLEDAYRRMWHRWCEHAHTEMGPRAGSEIPLIFDEGS